MPNSPNVMRASSRDQTDTADDKQSVGYVSSSFVATPNDDNKALNVWSLKTEWLNTEQAAAYLKLSVGALRNMTSNGQVPYHKLGKRNRYRTDELRALLLSQKRGVSHGN